MRRIPPASEPYVPRYSRRKASPMKFLRWTAVALFVFLSVLALLARDWNSALWTLLFALVVKP